MKKINEKELEKIFSELKENNNKEIYEKFYLQYKWLIYSISFGILKNKEDSEDVVQTVFTKIYKIDKEKLPTDKVASWLYSVTKNEVITLLRKKDNNVNIEEIYEIEDSNNEINEIIDLEQFNHLISGLSAKEKQIISLKIISNISFEDISKLLNEPTSTIKWRYYKSINTLKILLSNLGGAIIAFIIGIKTLYTKKNIEIIENKSETKDENKTENDNAKTEYNEGFQDKESNMENVTEETVIINTKQEKELNYYGVGLLSISAIFLIITIIFSIIFTKRQLKRKKKSSKL